MTIDRYELFLALVGLAALLAAWVPAYTEKRALSLPIVLVTIGFAIGAVGFGLPDADPGANLELTERLTELAVIVSLMGAGLKIDRPFGHRSWAATWRMVGIAMPLTIVAMAFLGWAAAGLGLAAAVLLGAVIAPTDPVLASEVQVGEPTIEGEVEESEAEDEVRFTLTSEGGLNDALAFPFVYAAIRLADADSVDVSSVLAWLGWDLLGRILIAVVVGVVVGRLVGIVAFRPPGPLTALAETPQGFLAIASTLLAYGSTELLHGYGFLAVFVAAVALRSTERRHDFHRDMHGFVEQTENLLVVGLLLLFGAALSAGVVSEWSWGVVGVAVLSVLVVRPLCGQLALLGSPLQRPERWAVAFFGIRGVGSVYYLAYAFSAADFDGEATLWSIVAATLLVSIVVHGVTATPLMDTVDRIGRRSGLGRPSVTERLRR